MNATLVVASHGLPDPAQARCLAQDLPAVEQQRLARLRQPEDRLRSLTARALLRRLLAQRLGTTAAQVPLSANSWGKPLLAGPAPAWHFNAAHGGERVLVALGPQPVGVDVEDCAAEADAALWEMATGTRREGASPQAFCADWVQREAVLKACGCGLSQPPDSVRLLAGRDGWRRVSDPARAAGLQVRLLWQSPEHCAALCLPDDAPGWRLTHTTPAAWMDALPA